MKRPRGALQLAALLALAVLIRLPFLDQAFQLDDHYYLEGAKYVQRDPLHPSRTTYVFLGEQVSMRGHPHPPLDVWVLGVILAAAGRISEVPFHVVYVGWSLLAVAGAWALARRFTARPVLATLLFMATPAFVVHGNALESDIPFLALWVAAAALFVSAVDSGSRRRLALAAAMLGLAALAAYQAVFLGAILALYLWTRRRAWYAALAVCAVPVMVIGAYQVYERLTSGAVPAAVLAGYLNSHGFQSVQNKVRNALALTAHTGWLVFPLLALAAFRRTRWWPVLAATAAAAFADPHPLFWMSFAIGAAVIAWRRPPDKDAAFLHGWIVLFFGVAIVLFFAGSARYLLPIAAPVAMLATRAFEHRPRLLAGTVAAQLVLSLALARSHYEHSNGYREFVRGLNLAGGNAWINGEWGLQYYGQQAGGRPMLRGQEVAPGDWIISNRLGFPVPYRAGGRVETLAERAITPLLPVRVIGLGSKSAFSTITFGVRPFDFARDPADVLKAERVAARAVTREYLNMSDADAAEHILTGLYDLEAGQWRWTGARAEVELKRAGRPARLEARVFLHENAAARKITLAVDGATVAETALSGPGMHTVTSGVLPGGDGRAHVTLTVDRTFAPPGDHRSLGVILHGIGFR